MSLHELQNPHLIWMCFWQIAHFLLMMCLYVLVGSSDHLISTYLAQRSHKPCTHEVISARSYRNLILLYCVTYLQTNPGVLSFLVISMLLILYSVLLLCCRDYWITWHPWPCVRSSCVKQNVSLWAAGGDVVTVHCLRDKLHRWALATDDLVIWQQCRSSCNKVCKMHIIHIATCQSLLFQCRGNLIIYPSSVMSWGLTISFFGELDSTPDLNQHFICCR